MKNQIINLFKEVKRQIAALKTKLAQFKQQLVVSIGSAARLKSRKSKPAKWQKRRLTIKVYFIKLYRKLQRRSVVIKVKVIRFKLQVSAWLARHKQNIWVTALWVAVVVIVAVGLYAWRRFPAFRLAGKAVGVSLAALLAGLLVRLNLRPTAVPIIVTKPPRREEGVKVYADGRH